MTSSKVNNSKKHKLISLIWDSSIIGRGFLSRTLAKLIIGKPKAELESKTLYGFDLLINPAIDEGVESSLYYFGTYEKGTLSFIENNLNKGDVFFDIGANIGLMSLFASKCVGNSGKVFSFEANPNTATILNRNILINNFTNITVIEKAVGNDTGKVKIYDNWSINRGAATLIKPTTETEFYMVDLICIDKISEFNNLKISMIKIDVEGFELDVLLGISNILKKNNPPKLIVECSADRNNNYKSVHEIFDFIKTINNYKIYKLSKGKDRLGHLVEIVSKEELPKHDNIFCIC